MPSEVAICDIFTMDMGMDMADTNQMGLGRLYERMRTSSERSQHQLYAVRLFWMGYPWCKSV